MAHEFLSNLKGRKRSIIENSIFSAFLDILNCNIHHPLAQTLIECYDAEMDAFIFTGQPLKFCNKEIEKGIGLSFEGKKVNFKKVDIVPQILCKYFEMVNGNVRIKKESIGANKKNEDEETRSSFRISRSLLLEKLKLMGVDEKLKLMTSFVYQFFTCSTSISFHPVTNI